MSNPSPPPPSDPQPPPALSPAIIADDEALAEAVDAFVANDGEATERLREIAAMQDALRAAVDTDVWQLVLRIDDMIVERWADLSVGIARLAFAAGQRHALPASGEGSS